MLPSTASKTGRPPVPSHRIKGGTQEELSGTNPESCGVSICLQDKSELLWSARGSGAEGAVPAGAQQAETLPLSAWLLEQL